MKNHELAAIYYKKAIYIVPHNVFAWLGVAKSYSELDDYNSVEEYLDRAFDANPESLELIMGSVEIYADFGKDDMVDMCFQKFMDLQIDNIFYWIDFAKIYIKLEDYDKVTKVINNAVQYVEDINEMMLYSAICSYKLGKREEAYDKLRNYFGTKEIFFGDSIFTICPEMENDSVIHDIVDSFNSRQSNIE